MPATDDAARPYGLDQPTMHDAREAVHRVHGADGASVWAQLLLATGVQAGDHGEAALRTLLDAMARRDPVSRLCAQALLIRLSSHAHLTAAHALTRS